jgi:hypothetical protein
MGLPMHVFCSTSSILKYYRSLIFSQFLFTYRWLVYLKEIEIVLKDEKYLEMEEVCK